MTFQLLISTMHKTKQEILNMLKKMNVNCDCVIINQCNQNMCYDEVINFQKIKILFTTERGLSKSRNMALKNSSADILAIADDDLYYFTNFDKLIISYYEENKNADVVLFGIDSYCDKCSNKEKKCNFLELGTYISFQTTFKRESIINNALFFNEYFGTGSGYYNSGEENIFLADCFRKKLNIWYCPSKILKRYPSESSWFKGFNDTKYIFDRGAIYYAISKNLSYIYYLRFLIVKRKMIKPVKIIEAYRLILKGRKKYKKLLKKR